MGSWGAGGAQVPWGCSGLFTLGLSSWAAGEGVGSQVELCPGRHLELVLCGHNGVWRGHPCAAHWLETLKSTEGQGTRCEVTCFSVYRPTAFSSSDISVTLLCSSFLCLLQRPSPAAPPAPCRLLSNQLLQLSSWWSRPASAGHIPPPTHLVWKSFAGSEDKLEHSS